MLVSSHESDLKLFRRGCVQGRATHPITREVAAQVPLRNAGEAEQLASLALCQARMNAEAGQTTLAMEQILDVCQFSRDWTDNAGISYEIAARLCFESAFEELRGLLSGPLTAQDCAEMARQLAILDGSFPRHGDIEFNDVVSDGILLQRGIPLDIWDPGMREFRPLSLWEKRRFAFSDRVIGLTKWEFLEGWATRRSDWDDMPWTTLSGMLKSEADESVRLQIPQFPTGFVTYYGLRQVRAQLRLLRVAAAHRATGDLLALNDPFGTTILTSLHDGRLKTWSLGWDGKDNQGKGKWRLRENEMEMDIVLEVERKP